MSTKAKIGKDWVKCQVTLAETGETLHLTFAPGQTKKKLVAHIDGRTDVGYVELKGLDSLAPPYNAVLEFSFNGEGTRAAKPAAVAPPKPVAPVAVAKPVPPPVAPAVELAPAGEMLPPPPEEIVVPEVQASATTEPVAGAKRGRPKANTNRDE